MTGTFARPSAIWFVENLMGLMVMAMLFGELFGGVGANPPVNSSPISRCGCLT